MNNILIAGGCVGKFILPKNISDQDIDIFIYGLNKEEAEDKIIEIYNSIRYARQLNSDGLKKIS